MRPGLGRGIAVGLAIEALAALAILGAWLLLAAIGAAP